MNVFPDRIFCDMSTDEDLRNYVSGSGVNFDKLSDKEKKEWRKQFDDTKGRFFLDTSIVEKVHPYLYYSVRLEF